MKAAADSIAVIRTRLPYLDRRALSEAWFSALHLARDARLSVPQRRAGDPGARPRAAAPPTAAREPALRPAPAPAAPGASPRGTNARSPEPKAAPGHELRVRLDRARRSERVHGVTIPPPLHASFTLTVAGARVQMLVRREGPALRITAICARAQVEAVRRALASADLVMRLRGHLIESQVRATGDLVRTPTGAIEELPV